jgi:DNA-binding LacI/PurR family transcriptional regulator
MEKLTIREIAKMAGVSPTTVSFVINGKAGIREETRAKVADVIARTHFRPSMNSRRLFFRKSYNITLAVRKSSSPFDNLFYFEVAKGLIEKSRAYGYNVVFTDLSVEDGRLVLPEIIKSRDTDGIIFLQSADQAILGEIASLGIPCVLVDPHVKPQGIPCVFADYRQAAFTAVQYLLERGHRAIAFIGSGNSPDLYMQCFSGYKAALDSCQAAIPTSWIQFCAEDEAAACACMEKILAQSPAPSAVFCSGDILAIGAIGCAKNRGLRVPEDLSFTAIDDILLSRYFEPKLTTVRIDKNQMGQQAMDLLAAMIDGQPADSVQVESGCIVERDTVRRLGPV